jgi:PAS domain S-box-containing protein
MARRSSELSQAGSGAAALRVLIVEDEPARATLLVRKLRRAGFIPEWQRVETEQEYLAHLTSTLDLILAEYNSPKFNALRALQLMRDRGLKIPFVVISGAVGEDTAISLLKPRALLTDRFARRGRGAHDRMEHHRLRREKEEAEAKLRETEERYRALFEHVPVGLLRSTPAGQILDANPALLDILGYPDLDTFRGVRVTDLYVDPEVRKQAQLLAESRGVAEFDAQVQRRDSTVIWIRNTIRAVRDAAGRISHYGGAIRDITQRKQAEDGLRRLAAIVEAADDAIFGVEPGGTITSWNAGAEKIFGYSREEILGRPVAVLIPPDRLNEIPQIGGRLEQGEHVHYDTVRIRKDGMSIHVSLTISPVTDAAGKIVEASSVAHDITGRRRAEEALRESEERFRLLAHASSDAVWDHDYLTGQVWRGEGTQTLFGYPPDPAQATTEWWNERVHPEDRARIASSIRAAIESGGHSWSDEYRFRRADGSYAIVFDRGYLLRDAAGRPLRMIGAMADVTERKRAEEAIRRLAAIVEAAADAIFGVELDGTITSWNPGAERMFGYSAEEILGRSVSVLYPRDRHGGYPQVAERLDRGEHIYVETVGVRKDGTHVHTSLTISPIKDAEGKVIRVSAVARDITERLRAEDELRKSEERFRLLARASNDVVWDHDLLTQRVWRGEAIHTLFGYPPETAGGREWWAERIHPEDRERVVSRLYALIDAGGVSWTDEYRFRRADGSYAHVSDRAYVVHDDDWRPLRVIGAMVDITERKRAEEALLKANEAARASREKSEFLSRMSHELRTPLNAVLGFAQLLEMESLPPEQREGVDQILNGGRHLLELINEVLDIARIEAGRLAISLEPVPLGEVVQETLDLITPLAAKANVTLHAEAALLPQRSALADRQRLKQVLLNLLSNAVKYNRPGGSVTLASEDAPEGRFRITVSDTGLGIPPEKMERLFIPFERLGAEQTGVEGSGLGLALSKRLVEAMGGILGADSTEGKGSTFWVEVAQADARIPEGTPAGPGASPGAGSDALSDSRTVLCIEDNLSNFEVIRHLLARRPGIRLLPAMQGQVGLDLAREHHPDLVLLDLHLPDISGDVVLRRLRANPDTAQIPVVMISADAMPAQSDRLLAAGAYAYLTKPLDIKVFLDLINQVLEGPPGGLISKRPGH